MDVGCRASANENVGEGGWGICVSNRTRRLRIHREFALIPNPYSRDPCAVSASVREENAKNTLLTT